MDRDTNTLIGICVMAAKMARDVIPGWVDEKTSVIGLSDTVRSVEFVVDLPPETRVYGASSWLESVGPTHDNIDVAAVEKYRHILRGTWIDGIYELRVAFSERANSVAYQTYFSPGRLMRIGEGLWMEPVDT